MRIKQYLRTPAYMDFKRLTEEKWWARLIMGLHYIILIGFGVVFILLSFYEASYFSEIITNLLISFFLLLGYTLIFRLVIWLIMYTLFGENYWKKWKLTLKKEITSFNELAESKERKMRWFNFYFVRLVINALVGFLLVFDSDNYSINPEINPSIAGLVILMVTLNILLAIGLESKKKLAYKLNFLYLFLDMGFMVLVNLLTNNWEMVLTAPVWMTLWIVPNWIYFKKRKDLFVN